MRRTRPNALSYDTYYVCDADGAVLAIVESAFYDEALDAGVETAERFGVDPETLSVLTPEEYEAEYGEED